MIIALAVALSGGFGAGSRYVVDRLVQRHTLSTYPYGTFAVNVVGSFLAGGVTGAIWYHGASDTVRVIVETGFCGGLTTWSTASWDTIRLAEETRMAQATIFALGGLAAGLAAALAGIALSATL
jgi:fluoride exporter